MLRFVRGDVRNGGENVRTVGRGSLDAVSVIDSAFPGFLVDIEVCEVVVEIDGTGAEVSSEERRVGRAVGIELAVRFIPASLSGRNAPKNVQDGGHVDVSLPAERNCESNLPLVEVGDDGLRALAGRELNESNRVSASFGIESEATYLSQKPGGEVAQKNGLVRFGVVGRGGDSSQVPEVSLPLIETVPNRPSVEQENLGSSLDEPAAVQELDSAVSHRRESADECRFR